MIYIESLYEKISAPVTNVYWAH